MTPEERKELILAGAIDPIDVSASLYKNEKAYVTLSAKRTAVIDQIIEKTAGKRKKEGVIVRGAIGFALMGPLGAATGALTAGSKNQSLTSQKVVSKLRILDTGELIFTNQRILFVGNKEVLSISYDTLMSYEFGRNLLGRTFTPRYENMLPKEAFIISGPAAAEAELFYLGITNHII